MSKHNADAAPKWRELHEQTVRQRAEAEERVQAMGAAADEYLRLRAQTEQARLVLVEQIRTFYANGYTVYEEDLAALLGIGRAMVRTARGKRKHR